MQALATPVMQMVLGARHVGSLCCPASHGCLELARAAARQHEMQAAGTAALALMAGHHGAARQIQPCPQLSYIAIPGWLPRQTNTYVSTSHT